MTNLSQGHNTGLTFENQIDAIYCIRRNMEKTRMIISVDAENESDNIWHPSP